MSYMSVICMVAFLTTMVMGDMPAPTDPTVTMKLTPKMFDLVSTVMTRKLGEMQTKGLSYKINIPLEGHDHEGSLVHTSAPTVDISIIPNDSTYSYEGYTKVTCDSTPTTPQTHRMRRSTEGHTHAKVLMEDTEFLEGKQIGGLQVLITKSNFNINFTHNDHKYEVLSTDCTMKLRIYIGSNEGELKIARVALDASGENKVLKDGEPLEQTDAERNVKSEMITTYFLKELKKHYKTYVTKMGQVITSEQLPHAVFDMRFTEQPSFHDGNAEMKMVGKFIYDKDSVYKGKSCEHIDFVLAALKELRREDVTIVDKTDRTTETFKLYETEETTLTTTLSQEGTDEAEKERALQGCIIFTVKEEFFNSMSDVMFKTRVLDIEFDKSTIARVANMAKAYRGMETTASDDTFEMVPEGMKFGVKFNELPTDKKHITFTEGGVERNVAFGLSFAGMRSDYLLHGKAMVLFRNGKMARDMLSVVLDKTADAGFPAIITQENLKTAFESYLTYADMYAFNPHMLSHLSEFSYHDGYFVAGIDCKPLIHE